MHVMRYSLAHGLLCGIPVIASPESPGCRCIRTILEQHHGYIIWDYVMATLWLPYGYAMAAENNVSAFPMAPWVFFQPLSSSLAYPGLNKQCEQQDNWHREQDQQDRHCSPWWLYQFTFPSTVPRFPSSLHPLQHVSIDFWWQLSNRCDVISHYGFDLHFLDD